MKLRFALPALAALASCIPTNETIIEDAQARSARSKSEARAELERVQKEWTEESDASLSKWQASLIFPICGDKVPAGSPCGMLADMYSKPTFQREFTEQRCAGTGLSSDDLYEFCSSQFSSAFNVALGKRYGLTPGDVCPGHDCSSFFKIELLMVTRFNEKVDGRGQLELDAINAKYRDESEEVLARFRARAEQIDRETEASLADAQRARSAMAAIGAGISAGAHAYANTLNQQPTQASLYTPTPVAPTHRYPVPTQVAQSSASPSGGCSNDFECGLGNVCAKDGGAFRGICAKPVDAYGGPVIHVPSGNSLGPGTGNCSFDVDCSVGFRCVKSSGGLRGNCMK
jgi:hypothetical protein